MAIEGGCRCGEVRYALDLPALPRAYACHCHLCQKWGGSAFSIQMLVPEDRLTIEGPVGSIERVTEDRVSTQYFCTGCISRIYNTNTRRPGIAVVRARSLDRSEEVVCAAHIFTAYKQGWVMIPEDVPSWPEGGDPDFFTRALEGR